MSKTKQYLFLIALLLSPFIAIAQNQKEIDKLEKELTAAKEDTNKVILLNQLGFLYRFSNNDTAKQYLDQAIALSNKLNYKAGLCGAYNRYGILCKNENKYDEAINYYNKSLSLAKELNDDGGIADVYNNIGNVYRQSGQPVKAVESFLYALRIREKIKDTTGIAAAYSNMGFVYIDEKNYPKAQENTNKAIEYYAMAGDSFELARAYGTNGYIYYYQNIFDKALEFDKKALQIFEVLGDKAASANLLNNIGNILTETGHAEQSIPYHTKALAIETSLGHAPGIFISNLSLAQTYNATKNYALAERYGEQALTILNKSGGIINMYVDAYELMAQTYKNNKNYPKAINAYELLTRYKDSMIKESNNQIVADLQGKYESDKKDLTIARKQLELNSAHYKITQRNIIAASLVAAIILILILGYLLYNRYKLRKQQELNEEIIKQQNIRSKAIIDAEEKERIRIAKDLHDGLGQQLSATKLFAQAIQPTATNEERAERMKELQKMLDEAVKEVRSVSHNMMPNTLLKSGLIAAVREFIDKIASTGLLKIDLQIIGLTDRLDTTVETVLYRVLQELVNNIIKHADAGKISIQIIKHEDNNLNLIMEDDGKGFDTSKMDSFDGIGLKNMISRVEYLNGTVTFDSQPGRGTTVIVDIPLS